MINVLPEQEKKVIDREYSLRRTAVALVMGILLTGCALAALVPSYILARKKAQTQITDQAALTTQADNDEGVSRDQIETAKGLMTVLQPRKPMLMVTDIVPIMNKYKTDQNTVTSLSYSIETGDTVKIIVQGIAKTRAGLSTFTDALRKEPGITDVDVPVSNFAKDSNISYSFTITVAPPATE